MRVCVRARACVFVCVWGGCRAYGDRTSPCDVSVRVEAVAPTEMETTAADEVAASAPGGAGDFEVCGNCHEKVPAGRLRLHQVCP